VAADHFAVNEATEQFNTALLQSVAALPTPATGSSVQAGAANVSA
jgi:hypothetical protein